MGELANPKHEQFAQALLTAPSQKAAYLAIRPDASPRAAEVNASNLIHKEEVRQRFFELLRQNNADLPAVSRRFTDFLHSSEHPAQSWDAVKTGLKIYGVLDEDKGIAGAASVQINIVNLSGDSNNTQP